ncbi:uncharacterized protein LOC111087121 [Limulus polyphemus]|uniref:Uncharacterized protein LOC111087121 n=1 Tax=Limulus polyphemus TaxID=6850 RepID=A0ABM1SXH4_LIMPO|nr:uncharacterized protein LOC111087121 [Limulus polyphemus]XP_022248329.1 uncharacterized protein LOC111087121 [Limulus polyphemus]XP_022248330.1 uncharacterized protein LOC111087121 [Limulus polyphemus]
MSLTTSPRDYLSGENVDNVSSTAVASNNNPLVNMEDDNLDNVNSTAVASNNNPLVNMEDDNLPLNKWTSENEELKISSECNTEKMQPFPEENGLHGTNNCSRGTHESPQNISNVQSDGIDVTEGSDRQRKSCVNTEADKMSVTNFSENSGTVSEQSDCQFLDHQVKENELSGIDTEERKYLHNRSLVPLKRCRKDSHVFASVNMNPCPRQRTRRIGINLFFPLSIRSLPSHHRHLASRGSTLMLLSPTSNSYHQLSTQMMSQRLRSIEYYYDYIDESYHKNGEKVSQTTIKLHQNSLPPSVIPPLTSDLYRYRFHSDTLALEQQKYSEVGKLLRTLSMDFEKRFSPKVS